MARLNRPLSRFELMISITVIALLMGLGVRKMLLLAAYAERQFMESTVININTALKYQAGLYRLRGQWRELVRMQNMNPFGLVAPNTVSGNDEALTPEGILEGYSRTQATLSPSRYLGELESPDIGDIDSGNWYYNRTNGTLVYVITNTEFFTSELAGPARIRFRVTVDYKDNNNNGRYDPGIDDFTGVELKNLEDYQWVL